MKFGPRDYVALILAVGVLAMLISSTSINLLWTSPEDIAKAREGMDYGEVGQFWRDVMNILLGGLMGYIGGRSNGNG